MDELSRPTESERQAITDYDGLVSDLVALLSSARSTSARAVNAIMTATYWEIGRRIVEHEQAGHARAGYGEELLARLAKDLTGRFGRGFSARGLDKMRLFYRTWPIPPTLSANSHEVPISPTLPATR